MSVYVDPLQSTYTTSSWRWKEFCHMSADTHAELMDMSRQLGLRPSWLQCRGTPKEHFDLTKRKREHAIRLGAVEVNLREYVEMIRRKHIEE